MLRKLVDLARKSRGLVFLWPRKARALHRVAKIYLTITLFRGHIKIAKGEIFCGIRCGGDVFTCSQSKM